MIGGISRVLRRVDDISTRQSELADDGLSDLKSLRTRSRELITLVQQIERNMASAEESHSLRALLDEYGLAGSVVNKALPDSQCSSVSAIVSAALGTRPGGAMLESDLFCLVNRSSRLESVLSPTEFHEIITSLCRKSGAPLFSLVQLEGWSIIVLRRLFDVHAMFSKLEHYFAGDPAKSYISVSEFRLLMSYESSSLALVGLSRIERDLGTICRDNGGDFGEVRFYENLYFR